MSNANIDTALSAVSRKQPISTEDYARILAGINLTKLSLIDCQVKADNMATQECLSRHGNLPLVVKEKASFDMQDGIALVRHGYYLSSKDKNKVLMSIKADYLLIFETSETFTEDFFEVFKCIALPVFTWSYFRELADSMTSRMDFPRLVLPLWRQQ